jgi:hypothetical protein
MEASPVTTKKKQELVDGTVEEWVPKTAHEVAVAMFHGIPGILVPARHHLTKVTGTEARTALKAVDQAIAMVKECTVALAKTPGPIRANFRDGETFVIVESDTNRVTVDSVPTEERPLMQQVNVLHRRNSSHEWVEVTAWDVEEWETSGSEAFEAIIRSIARVTAGVEITPNEAAAAD